MSRHNHNPDYDRPTAQRPLAQGGLSSRNLGTLLAVLAGAFIIGTNIWPAARFVGEGGNPPPWYLAMGLGVLYVAAPIIAQRSANGGRLVLALAALGLLAWGLFALDLWGTSAPLAAWLVVLAPTIVGLIAAPMLGRVEPGKGP